MYEIIAASSLWSKMFRKAFGLDALLYFTGDSRIEKLYAIYVRREHSSLRTVLGSFHPFPTPRNARGEAPGYTGPRHQVSS